MNFDHVLQAEIREWQEKGTFRSLRTVASAQGREIVIEGERLLNFCSNDYLGLAADPRPAAAAQEALARLGTGSGASRLVCGSFEEHALLEQEVATFKGTEAALVFGSGYMANTGIIPALVGRNDVVFSDRLNHASLVDGIVLSRADLQRYAHNDMLQLEAALRKAGGKKRRLIVTDAVFSMDGDTAFLKEIVELARRYEAWVMVDEAHSFGLFGASGAGLAEELGVQKDIHVQMGTLSKAAGVIGAYAAGSQVLRDYLVNRARSFVFTTAMPPAMAAAARASLQILRAEPERRQRVLALASRLRTGLRGMGLNVPEGRTPIIPVMIGDDQEAVRFSRELAAKGFFVPAIRPPTVPAGTARLRVTVTAAHTDADIEKFLKVFKS